MGDSSHSATMEQSNSEKGPQEDDSQVEVQQNNPTLKGSLIFLWYDTKDMKENHSRVNE